MQQIHSVGGSRQPRMHGIGRFLITLLGVAAGVELMGWLTGERVNELQTLVPGIDKILHCLGFAVLYVACVRMMRRVAPNVPHGPLLLIVGLGILAGADEAGQAFSPGRHVDAEDLIASLSGLMLGVAFAGPWARGPSAVIGAAAVAAGMTVAVGAAAKQVHLNDARQFERNGDFVSAREAYQRALASGVRSASLYNALGWVEIESGVGNPRVAVEYAARALKMDPENPDFSDTYGWALHHAGRSAEALPFLERAYGQKPDMFCVHYHLAEVYLALSRPDDAVAHYSKQLALDDTREAALSARALERLGLRHASGNDLVAPHHSRTKR